MTDKTVLPTDENIRAAARAISDGGLVVFPTETVYGIGADAASPAAVRRIFEAKGRPSDNPLIVHVADHDDVSRLAEVTDTARRLMETFWPGPLSIVLTTRGGIPDIVTAGLSTAAFRMPRNEIALALIRASGVPIAAPSANKSGRPSPTDAASALLDVGSWVEMVLDGGRTGIGLESTVVDATGSRAVVLREGGVSREMLEKVVQTAGADEMTDVRRSPGTRHRHYAPTVPVMLWSGGDIAVESDRWSFIGMAEPPLEWGVPVVRRLFGGVDEYARELFFSLREFEIVSDIIIAELPDSSGIGAALRDRLERAAAKS